MERSEELEVYQADEAEGESVLKAIEGMLDERIVRAIREMGFEKLSPIQEQAIPYLLEGEDIIGQAQTGRSCRRSFCARPGSLRCRRRRNFAGLRNICMASR